MEEVPNQSVEPPLSEESHDESPFLPISPPIEYYQPTRLGIIHLLAWVTVAAVMMKFNLATETIDAIPQKIKLPDHLILSYKLFEALRTIGVAAIVTGGFVFWGDRFRRKPGKIQPGHWIVAIYFLAIPEELYFRYLIFCMQSGSRLLQFSSFLFCYNFVWALLISFAFGWGMLRLPGPRRWKWGLGLLGAEYLAKALITGGIWLILTSPFREMLQLVNPGTLITTTNTLSTYFGFAVSVFLLLVNIVDVVKGLRRDWLHWLGAITPIISVLLPVIGAVVNRLFLHP
jgi:hypothetical protein